MAGAVHSVGHLQWRKLRYSIGHANYYGTRTWACDTQGLAQDRHARDLYGIAAGIRFGPFGLLHWIVLPGCRHGSRDLGFADHFVVGGYVGNTHRFDFAVDL